MTVPDNPERDPHLERLKVWAEARGLRVQASRGTQREPENVVAVMTGTGATVLVRRGSLDSIDAAAMYVLNTIDRLSGPSYDLPPDLLRVLRDPNITVARDHEIRLADGRTLFEHLQEWRNAPSKHGERRVMSQHEGERVADDLSLSGSLYVCENCGQLGAMSSFQDDCTPGWTHGRLVRVKSVKVTDELVDGALLIFDEIDAAADPTSRTVREARAWMRQRLQALAPEEANDA